jgi:polysaccharide export outer membrane protein
MLRDARGSDRRCSVWLQEIAVFRRCQLHDQLSPRCVLPCLTLAALLAGGLACSQTDDTRLSLEQFQAETQAAEEAATSQPAEVNPTEFGLKEVQPYAVTAGDVLNVELIGVESEYSKTQFTLRVHPDGSITLPLVGKVSVAGRDLAGVEAAVINAFVPNFVPRLSCYARLDTPAETTVVVVGASTTQGVITLPRAERNVLYALAKAGGINPATTGAVTVKPARAGREEARYTLTSIEDLRRALASPPLESGDMIVVEAAPSSRVFVTGLVNTPGVIELPKGSTLSLVRAVAASGGLIDFVGPTEATLWRVLRDGKQVRVKLPLGEIMSGEQEDIALAAGDVLEIPHTDETRFRQWVLENIRIGPFGVTAVYDPVQDYYSRILADDDDDNDNVFRSTLESSINQAFNQAFLRTTVTP